MTTLSCRYWPALWPSTGGSGGARGALCAGGAADADDRGAHVAPGEAGVDQFEVAVHRMRCEGGLHDRTDKLGKSNTHQGALRSFCVLENGRVLVFE